MKHIAPILQQANTLITNITNKPTMVPSERAELTPDQFNSEHTTSPRISFSEEFTNGANFIPCTNYDSHTPKSPDNWREGVEFEFLCSTNSNINMLTADELFFEGRLRPIQRAQVIGQVEKIMFEAKEEQNKSEVGSGANWYVNDDPSPRLPTCTVLWKELLRLKKQNPASSQPSSSSHLCPKDEEKHGRGMKKGLERTRSGSVRIRPMVHLPLCNQGKNSAMPLLFALKNGGK